MLLKTQFVNTWSHAMTIGRIKERFIRFKLEDMFNSAVTDRCKSISSGLYPRRTADPYRTGYPRLSWIRSQNPSIHPRHRAAVTWAKNRS